MLNKTFFTILFSFISLPLLKAQTTKIIDSNIKTVVVTVNLNKSFPKVLRLNSNDNITISFDELSHDIKDYYYKVEHVNALWKKEESIFESDYLKGSNENNLIEDYNTSINTNILYTHYELTIPNNNINFTYSGNYRLTVYEEYSDEPSFTTDFSVVDPKVIISMKADANTDIDFQKSHQQLSISVNFNGLNITDPSREIKVVAQQNNQIYNEVVFPKENYYTGNLMNWEHCEDLVFESGNEYHKFELLNTHQINMGVDRIRWNKKNFDAFLNPNKIRQNYIYDEEQNGLFYIRNSQNNKTDYGSEYLNVHFNLLSDYIPGKVYIVGELSNYELLDDFSMDYNAKIGCYTKSLLLKQGYYNYRYIYTAKDGTINKITMNRMDGDFYQTENKYFVYVYYKPLSGRYTQLIGYKYIDYNQNKE